MKKQSNIMKKQLSIADSDSESEVEERVIKKNPKKKRVVYREESESEEEVIVKRVPKKVKEPQQPLPAQQPITPEPPRFRINFC